MFLECADEAEAPFTYISNKISCKMFLNFLCDKNMSQQIFSTILNNRESIHQYYRNEYSSPQDRITRGKSTASPKIWI